MLWHTQRAQMYSIASEFWQPSGLHEAQDWVRPRALVPGMLGLSFSPCSGVVLVSAKRAEQST